MSESQEGPAAAVAAPADSTPARESIGTYLAAQRRLRGISIEDLSEQTRIPLRSLQRLESGSFDGDVDGFVRGFVRTVAEALGLDPEETLNRTLPEPGGATGRATPRLSLRRVAASFLLLAVLGGVGFAVQVIAASLRDASAVGPRSLIVIRRDPVRDLAEAQGLAALEPAPAAGLASEAERNDPAAPTSGATPDEAERAGPDAVARP